jgi:hypothetical protein
LWIPATPQGAASSFLRNNGISANKINEDVEYDVHVRIEYVEDDAEEPPWFWIHWYWEPDGYFYSLKAGKARPEK